MVKTDVVLGEIALLLVVEFDQENERKLEQDDLVTGGAVGGPRHPASVHETGDCVDAVALDLAEPLPESELEVSIEGLGFEFREGFAYVVLVALILAESPPESELEVSIKGLGFEFREEFAYVVLVEFAKGRVTV